MKKCKYCNGDIEIRNPTGKCDHLYYPEYANKSLKMPEKKDKNRPNYYGGYYEGYNAGRQNMIDWLPDEGELQCIIRHTDYEKEDFDVLGCLQNRTICINDAVILLAKAIAKRLGVEK